jgi:hypothetical protein
VADFSYTTVPGKLSTLLEKIHGVGIPPKASVQWLKQVGFTSSNDASLLTVLKQIGFIDSSSAPTEHWKNYRGAHRKRVLGDAIRSGYKELFAVYPDAWKRSQQDIEHVFSTSSSAGKQVIAKTVTTFKNLCTLAEFEDSGIISEEKVHAPGPLHNPVTSGGADPTGVKHEGQNKGSKSTPSVHIDIQVHISPESTPEQIDQIFRSMAKHLYGNK